MGGIGGEGEGSEEERKLREIGKIVKGAVKDKIVDMMRIR